MPASRTVSSRRTSFLASIAYLRNIPLPFDSSFTGGIARPPALTDLGRWLSVRSRANTSDKVDHLRRKSNACSLCLQADGATLRLADRRSLLPLDLVLQPLVELVEWNSRAAGIQRHVKVDVPGGIKLAHLPVGI